MKSSVNSLRTGFQWLCKSYVTYARYEPQGPLCDFTYPYFMTALVAPVESYHSTTLEFSRLLSQMSVEQCKCLGAWFYTLCGHGMIEHLNSTTLKAEWIISTCVWCVLQCSLCLLLVLSVNTQKISCNICSMWCTGSRFFSHTQ